MDQVTETQETGTEGGTTTVESAFDRALARLGGDDEGGERAVETTEPAAQEAAKADPSDTDAADETEDKPTHQRHNFDKGLSKLQKERAEDRKLLEQLLAKMDAIGQPTASKVEKPEPVVDDLAEIDGLTDEDIPSVKQIKALVDRNRKIEAELAELRKLGDSVKPIANERAVSTAKAAFEKEYPGVSFEEGVQLIIPDLKRYAESNPKATPDQLDAMADAMIRQYGRLKQSLGAAEQPKPTATAPTRPTASEKPKPSATPRSIPTTHSGPVTSPKQAFDKWLDDPTPLVKQD